MKMVVKRSENIYGFLLKLYPKRYRQEFGEEMEYVFSELLKDAYRENGLQGVFNLWTRTIMDEVKSLVIQHLENNQEGVYMKTKSNDIIMQNKIFIWITMGTILLLMVPLSLMSFKIPLLDPGSGMEVINWTLSDFIVMGILLFSTGSLFVLAARKVDRKYWLAVAIVCVLAFLWLWAELAVGIFTNWGS